MDELAGYPLDHGLMRAALNGTLTEMARNSYTRAEVLAFGERVREACEKAVVGIGPAPLRGTYDNGVDDSADSVRAVDVARLLEGE